MNIRRLFFTMFAVLGILLPQGMALATQPANTVDVRIWTFNTSDSPVFDICYTLVGYSNMGCDENQDGAVLFEDIPYGTYQVEASYPNGSDYYVDPFTIVVDESNSGFTATALLRGQSSVDVRIWTEDISGQSVTDVCYQLAGYSQVGCDENGDGNVLFEDIPYGRYLVVASYPGGSNHRVAPFHIDVAANNTDIVAFAETRSSPVPQTGFIKDKTELFLITRDPETGDALTGACYELVGYSNVGCDENNDGRVSFEDIPYSTYTIRQVTAPAGHQPMDDYIVSIMPTDVDGPVSLLLVQAEQQAPEDRYNVSVVFVDATTNQPVMNPANCAQLRDESGPITLRGCDDGIVDGQVDFVDVAYDAENGSSVNVALACPYVVAPGAQPQLLWVGQSSLFLYVHVVDSGKPCN